MKKIGTNIIKYRKYSEGELDIIEWILWFLTGLLSAIEESLETINKVVKKYAYLERVSGLVLNERQNRMITTLITGTLYGTLTSSKWSKMNKCSPDTAFKDIKI